MQVPHSFFINIFKDSPLLKKYQRWLCLSFTNDNKDVKWCPNTGCDYAVNKISDLILNQDIMCICGTSFCFMCGRESHSPADCKMVLNWDSKNNNESEDINWIVANTKPCPNKKCGLPIEKNQGCNHMQCKQCEFEFCWVCLGKWSDHNSSTGGYYKCNRYKDDPQSEENKKILNTKNELSRYIFHFERYMNHHKSQQLAAKLLPVIDKKTSQLHQLKQYPIKELEFLTVSLQEIIKCRQVLKYTYTYGFYQTSMNKTQRNLFEHHQMLLEEACDLLHEQIEKPLDPFLNPDITDRSPFFKFKSSLVGLSNATKSNYESFIRSIEK